MILEQYIYDEPSAEQKPLADDEDRLGQSLSATDNKLRMKAAKATIDRLYSEIKEVKNENEYLVSNKADLLNKTSKQIEIMRDKLENMAQQLVDRERTIKELIHINKEGYNPDDDQKSEVSWMGISNSVKNGLLTFGRSKFSSTPKKALADTKQAKIDLAISASLEIERLRSIIRTLSNQSTTTGGGSDGLIKTQKNGLINGLHPGTH